MPPPQRKAPRNAALDTFVDVASALLPEVQYTNIKNIALKEFPAVDMADSHRYGRISTEDGTVLYTDTMGVYTSVAADIYVMGGARMTLVLHAGSVVIASVSSEEIRVALASGGMVQSVDGGWTVYASVLTGKEWYKATLQVTVPGNCSSQLAFTLKGVIALVVT